VHGFAGTFGYTISPIIVVTVAAFAGWRTALMVVGLLGLTALAVLLRFRDALASTPIAPRDAPARPAAKFGYASLIATPAIMLAMAYFALSAAAGTGVQTFAVAALHEIYEVPVSLATMALTIYLLGSASGTLLGGVIADKTDRYHLIASTGLAISAVMWTAIAGLALPFAVILVLVAVAGAAVGSTGPSRDMLVRAATPPGAAGKVFGFVYSGLDFGGTLAPAAFGWLVDHGQPRGVFGLMALLLLFTIGTVLQVRRRSPQAAIAAAKGAD
jgi:predicted MFS family arabinose efflux permease